MVDTVPRTARRRATTRAALIAAAQRALAEHGRTDMSIQELTDSADVGFGSFYNHFESKEALFDVAIEAAFSAHNARLDALLRTEKDPAVQLANRLRLSARTWETNPTIARILMYSTRLLLASNQGPAPRAKADIIAATSAGRFTAADPLIALTCAFGALTALLQSFAAGLIEDVPRATDEMVHYVLRMLGMPDDEAKTLASSRLPSLPPNDEANMREVGSRVNGPFPQGA